MADSEPDSQEKAPAKEETKKPVKEGKPKAPSKRRKSPKAAKSGAPEGSQAEHEMQAHHVSKILDEVLDEPEDEIQPGHVKHPMWLDLTLAVALLIAVGGFTIGLFKIYITHTAEQSIAQHNYRAAIAILKGAPLPGFFTIPGSDPDELLAQSLYLDAMDKLEVQNDSDAAVDEFQQIRPGSRFFPLAQEIIEEQSEPSPTRLEGGTSITEMNPPKEMPEKKPILPELKDASP